ncbi:MAG: Crp/Fnr family transcriptional regulator [Anaerolineae bacterium]|nr:Crp/Fnr family transcriptional regulator [Anaerolineae bacterium]
MPSKSVTISTRTLADVPALARLSPDTLEHLAQQAIIVSRHKGEVFYRQGDPPSGLFALQEGRVKLYRQSRERVQILALLIPGECFGATSLPDDSPCPCSAEAVTPATAIYVPPEALRCLFETHPDLMITLLEMISNQLRQLAALVHDLAFRDVSARLARVLLARAHAEGEVTAEGLRIERVLSQQELAAMVGTAREVIYRAIRDFEQAGLLRQTRTEILILNPAALAAIAEREVR